MEDGECNCVICMQAVDDSDCMVTPCNHVFHSACLQRWMEEKMEWYVGTLSKLTPCFVVPAHHVDTGHCQNCSRNKQLYSLY